MRAYSTPRLPVAGFVGIFGGAAGGQQKNMEMKGRKKKRERGEKGRAYDPKLNPVCYVSRPNASSYLFL